MPKPGVQLHLPVVRTSRNPDSQSAS